MKILIVTQKVDKDDAILGFFHYWIESIAKHVEHVYVISLAKGQYDLPKNVTVISLGKEKGASKISQAIRFYLYAFKFLLKVDGVFVHMAPEYVRALYPLNIFFRKPVVMWYAHIKVSPTAKWAINHVDYALTPSKESFEYNSEKVVSTGHGINTEMFKPMYLEPVADVLVLSRISKVKRIETLIETARILKERGVVPIIDIYGKPARLEDDAYLLELKNRVEKYGLNNIFWKGEVANKDTPVIYANHKIFVRMQGGGGFGKTELEAMSMGMPSIVPTDVYKKDLGEFAKEVYFNEGNSEELAGRIESVLKWDEPKRKEYARLARQIVVKNHNVENVAKAIVDTIREAR